MAPLAALCLVLGVLGALLIVLSLLPATGGRVPGGMNSGIVLVVVAVLLYVVLAVTGVA